jgi:hypothetical protein
MQAAAIPSPETLGQTDSDLKNHDLTGPLAELMA